MNLVIDIGNSAVKTALFNDNTLVLKETATLDSLENHLQNLRNQYTITQAILASVGQLSATQLAYMTRHFDLCLLDHNTKLPFENKYKTPETLGVDRIALVSASVLKYPNKNTLIIDAGTCVTYDFISDENVYWGGAISPGISMRYKALHDQTTNLPQLHKTIPQALIGGSSHQAIHSGVVMGLVGEIDYFIKSYAEIHKGLTVILTGGDANFLSKQLKSSIFANPNFLLEGLNYILQFNSI